MLIYTLIWKSGEYTDAVRLFMENIFTLQFTIFALIAVGCFSRKLNIITADGQKSINNLVIYIVLPCSLFKSFMVEFSMETLISCLSIFLIAVGCQIVAPFYGRLMFGKTDPGKKKCLYYGTIVSNSGFIGNPVAEGVFGSIGLLYASFFLVPMRFAMWTEGIAIFTGISDKKAAFKKVATHPCIIATLLGLICMVAQIPVPAPVIKVIGTIGNCNTALSMMVVGMILAQIDPKNLIDPVVIVYSLHRLILMPLIVYIILLLLPLQLSHTVIGTAVLLMAMPAGATTSILASKYDMEPEFATKMVIFSTLLSIPSICIWSIILH